MKHKNYKNLTRKQKILLSQQPKRFNVDNWLCVQEDNSGITIKHKVSGRVLFIEK